MEHKTNAETIKWDLVWGKRENERATTSKKTSAAAAECFDEISSRLLSTRYQIKVQNWITTHFIWDNQIITIALDALAFFVFAEQRAHSFFLSSGLTNAFLIHHDCAFFLTPFRYKVILQIWLLSISCKNNHFLFFPGKMVMAFQCSANPSEWREMK